MNKAIKSLSWDKLVFFDLEMASGEKELDPKSEFFKIFQWKNRDRETDKLPTVKETQELYKRKAALDPISGRIICGTVGYLKDDVISVKSFQGEEVDVVKGVTDALNNSNRMCAGYNSIFFDHPYLRKRHSILGLGDFPEQFNDVGKKEWKFSESVFDIMTLFKGTGYANSSLEELCWAYKVKSPKEGDVKGDECSKVFWEGGIDKIVQYNIRDVVATINLLRALRGESQIEDIIIK
jgi:DNA polymerase elongation subunit (family B)